MVIAQKRVLFDRRRQASAKKLGTVEIEIQFAGERLRLSTGVRVYRTQWKHGMVVNHPDADDLNCRIQAVGDALLDKVNRMLRKGSFVDVAALKKLKAKTLAETKSDFISWLESRIVARDRIKEVTRKQHLVMCRALKEFGMVKNFSDLTTRNIRMWDSWLHKKGISQASVHGYHKRLKPYVKEAVELQLCDSDPYLPMRIPRGKRKVVRYLTVEERSRVEGLRLYGPTAKARDMFIFSCYTGLSFCDLAKIRPTDIKFDGEHWYLEDTRQKTGVGYKIILLDEAKAILDKYHGRIDLMTNQQANANLKLVAHMAGIQQNLTMHMGRHTFATWALSKGVQIDVVSKMLAHSSVSMTEHYAKVMKKSVESGYDKLADSSVMFVTASMLPTSVRDSPQSLRPTRTKIQPKDGCD